ncbi:MAG: ATP-dependent 6-phosphofructokinase [Armatimonadota bacterium]
MKRIAISTGGGDCPGLNAVIRAVFKTAHIKYKAEVLGIEDGFDGLIKPDKIRKLTPHDVSGIISEGGTILGTTNRGNPFSYRVVKGDKVERHDYSKRVINKLKELKVDCMVVIGGDGTLKIAKEFFDLGVNVVGVPKTIDNDLDFTDVTFGFDTAVNTAMEAIDRIRTTGESHHRVMVVEVMGREAGWIALHSGISGGASVILIPEIPFEIDKVCEHIKQRHRQGLTSSIVVVSEGAYPKSGKRVYKPGAGDPGANKVLGGIGERVGNKIEAITRFETRTTVLGHIQRGGSPSARDRTLGTIFGAMAVELAAKKDYGKMVAIHKGEFTSASLAVAVGKLKLVRSDNPMLLASRSIGVEFGD